MAQTTSTYAQKLPTTEQNVNVRTIFRRVRDVMTGAVGTNLIASNSVVDGSELLFKNGSLLTPTDDYTVDGVNITLDVAAIAGDIFIAMYQYRAER